MRTVQPRRHPTAKSFTAQAHVVVLVLLDWDQ
jgi:hypothetical protein